MKERLGVLDGLRGIAILQVLWFHLWVVERISAPVPWLQFIPRTGNFGVHLFFFLSGFVIVYPFVRALNGGRPEPTWTHFAWRRFIKIVPSYALSIAVAYAIGFAALERTHSTVLQELVTHALFIHTWWTGTASSVNGVLWTLAIEAQFYAIFPFVWWCFKRRPWPTGLGLIVLAWALRMWGERYFPAGAATVLAMNLPNFIDLFACGMLSAWCFTHFGQSMRHGRARYLAPAMAIAGATMMTVAFIAVSQGHAWPRIARVQLHEILGMAFGLLAFGALCSSREWTVALANPLLRFFAIVSYNLYLCNWMIMRELQRIPMSRASFTVAALVVSIAFATLVTYLLERPLLRLPDPHLTSDAFRHATNEN